MESQIYQQKSSRTLLPDLPFEPSRDQLVLTWRALKLVVHMAKLVECLKKGIWHQHGLDTDQVRRYLAGIELEAAKIRQVPFDDMFVPVNFSETDVFNLWNLLGLVGESGEVAEVFLAAMENILSPDRAGKELGDVAWYTSAMATKNNLDMGAILEDNILDLMIRYPAGYTSADSIARLDVNSDGADISLIMGVDAIKQRQREWELLTEGMSDGNATSLCLMPSFIGGDTTDMETFVIDVWGLPVTDRNFKKVGFAFKAWWRVVAPDEYHEPRDWSGLVVQS